jgi:hypothetical protein
MSLVGTSRHFAASQQFGRYWCIADSEQAVRLSDLWVHRLDMPTRPPHVCFIGKSRISSLERYTERCDGQFGDLTIELYETEERLLTGLGTLRRGLRGTQDCCPDRDPYDDSDRQRPSPGPAGPQVIVSDPSEPSFILKGSEVLGERADLFTNSLIDPGGGFICLG